MRNFLLTLVFVLGLQLWADAKIAQHAPISTPSTSIPEQQEQFQILSLNNSLIAVNNQPKIFNAIAKEMGRNAHWDSRTQMGKTLLFHYNNDMSHQAALSKPWDYIILQEQSALPRVYPDVFTQSVELWWKALNQRFGEEIPTIIIPMNWGYNNPDEFMEQHKKLLSSYKDLSRDMPGVLICPIGIAYEIIFNDYGQDEWLSLYTDNLHPSLKAAYLGACMEYALIYDVSPETITYVPEGMTVEEARRMREVAQKAFEKWNAEKPY